MELTIPQLTYNKVDVFFNDKYLGEADADQVNKMRIRIVEEILSTNDESILEGFFIFGHLDTNYGMGERVKVTMDKFGNLSEMPYELSHRRMDILRLIKLGKLIKASEKLKQNEQEQ